MPFITDTDEKMQRLVAAAKQYGANYDLTACQTLFGNDQRDSKQLFFKFIRNHYPHLIEKYERMYGHVHYPSWQYQRQLRKRADALCEKYKIKNSIR